MGVRINHTYLLVVFSFLAACTNRMQEENKHPYSLTKRVLLSDSLNTIIISNSANYAVSFTLDINNKFPLTIDKILKEIHQSKLPYPQSAWYYVKENTFSANPFSSEKWQHTPELFLNSLGGGLCDDRASVLAYIYKAMGDSVRVKGLNGHIVTEIYYNNKWQMFDADNGVYYCDENSVVLSVDELEHNPDRIRNPQYFCNSQLTNPVFSFPNPTATRFADFYASSDDNTDVTEWHMPAYKCDSQFVLPSHSSLKFVFDANKTIANVIVELTEASKGELKIPFVSAWARGRFNFVNENRTVNVEDTTYTFPIEKIHGKIDIQMVNSSSRIYYLVNPKLQIISDTNYVQITSSSTIGFTQQTSETTGVRFAQDFLFFDTIQKKYPTFYKELEARRKNESLVDYLSNQYLAFLKRDDVLSELNIKEMTEQFKSDINYMSENDIAFQNLLEKHYPVSIFYLFAASKYKRMDYLNEILNERQ